MKTNQLLSKTLCSVLFAGAILLSSTVFAQVKIGTNPTTIGATNNLEVEASTAGNKVSIDKTTGKITIADGSQGVSKILTSDVNGVATWQSPASIKIPVTAFTGYNTGSSSLNTNNTTTPVPLTVVNPSSAWNSSTSEYTIPSDGLYRFEYNSMLNNSAPGKTYFNEWITMMAGGKQSTFPMSAASGGWGISLFIVGKFTAGQKVKVVIYSIATDNVTLLADPMIITDATFFSTKLD